MQRPRITFVAVTMMAFVPLQGCSEPVHRVEPLEAMGRVGFIELYMSSDTRFDAAVAEVRQSVERVADLMSYERPASELAELNRRAAEGYYVIEDQDLYHAVRLALDYARASRGAFDPTVAALGRLYDAGVPDAAARDAALESVGWQWVAVAHEAHAVRFRRPGVELDLGAISKGYALHVASRVFSKSGSRAGLLVLGGNAYAWGAPPGEEYWPVPVMDPRNPARTLLTLRIANRGVAVSGQRHAGAESLFDPLRGVPVAGEMVLAIGTGHTAGDADAFATALAASSYEAATDLLARMRNVEAAMLIRDGDSLYLLASASLRGRLTLAPEFDAEIGGDVRYLLLPEKFPDGPA